MIMEEYWLYLSNDQGLQVAGPPGRLVSTAEYEDRVYDAKSEMLSASSEVV